MLQNINTKQRHRPVAQFVRLRSANRELLSMSNATFRVMASSFCEVCRSTSLVTGDNVTSVSSLDVAYSSHVYFYGRYCVFVVEAIIIVVANILTLIAVKQTKKLRQIPTNTFIVRLASADGIIGLLSPGILLISRTDSQTL